MTTKRRLTATVLALLILITSVFTFTTVKTKTADAGIYTRLSVKLKGGNGEVYAEAENEFTFFPATVRVYIQLYRSENFEESYKNMTLVSSNYTGDLDQGEKVRAYASTDGRRSYYLARMYYKIDSDEWTEKTMGVFRFDGNGNELYGLPVYSYEYLKGATQATVTAENSFTVDYERDMQKLVSMLNGVELDKVGAMPIDAKISIEFDNGLTVYAFDDGTLYFKVVKPYADGIYRSADKVDFADLKVFLGNLSEDITTRVEIDVYGLISDIINRYNYLYKEGIKISISDEYMCLCTSDLNKLKQIATFFAYTQTEFRPISYSDYLEIKEQKHIELQFWSRYYVSSSEYYYIYLTEKNDILVEIEDSNEYAVFEGSNLSYSKLYKLIKGMSPDVEINDIKLDELIKEKDQLFAYFCEGYEHINSYTVENKERIEEVASFFKDITFEKSFDRTMYTAYDEESKKCDYIEISCQNFTFNKSLKNFYFYIQNETIVVSIQQNEAVFYFKSKEDSFDRDIVQALKNYFKF